MAQIDESNAAAPCNDPTRRTLLLTALAGCACLAATEPAAADEEQPGASERPQKSDVLVRADALLPRPLDQPGC